MSSDAARRTRIQFIDGPLEHGVILVEREHDVLLAIKLLDGTTTLLGEREEFPAVSDFICGWMYVFRETLPNGAMGFGAMGRFTPCSRNPRMSARYDQMIHENLETMRKEAEDKEPDGPTERQ